MMSISIRLAVQSTRARTLFLATLLSAAVSRPVIAQCPDGTPSPCARGVAALHQSGVAILYFEIPQGDTTLSYLADGLTEALIDRLTGAGLTVASRYQVRRFANRTLDDPAVLGRALNVSTLVTGTLRSLGPNLRISIEMIKSSSGARLWGQQFEQSAGDLLHIETAIATVIADSIAGRLQPARRRALNSTVTTIPAAYDHLLRGRYYLAQRTGAAIIRGVQELEEAVRLDPHSARLRAELGLAYTVSAALGESQDSLLRLASMTADRALRLDSLSATGWLVRASTLWLRIVSGPSRDLTSAAHAAERSLKIDSLDPEAWLVYGEILSDGGADDHADSAYRQSLALDSRSARTLERLARLDEDRHRFDEALQLLDSALAVEPGFNESAVQYRRVQILLRMRRLPEARLALERAGPFASSLRPLVLLSGNDFDAARAAVESLPHPSFPAVVSLAALGEIDRALSMLETITSPTLNTYRLLRLPEMDPIRGDPRFQRLLSASQPLVYLR